MDRKTIKTLVLSYFYFKHYLLFIHSPTHSFIHLFGHTSFIHSFVHSLTHLFIHFADNIEANVEIAATRVESGNKQLGRAVKHKVRRYVKILIYLSSSFVFCHLF